MPPSEIREKIANFGVSNAVEHVQFVSDPYIRVAFKDGMDPYPEWEDVMSDLAVQTQPFSVTLGEPVFLGEYLLALPVISPELVAAHAKSVELIAKYDAAKNQKSEDQMQGFYETQSVFTPYLTLATGMFGEDSLFGLRSKRKAILAKAKAALKGLPAFTVESLALYEALVFDNTYEPKGLLRLGVQGGSVEAATGLVQVTA